MYHESNRSKSLLYTMKKWTYLLDEDQLVLLFARSRKNNHIIHFCAKSGDIIWYNSTYMMISLHVVTWQRCPCLCGCTSICVLYLDSSVSFSVWIAVSLYFTVKPKSHLQNNTQCIPFCRKNTQYSLVSFSRMNFKLNVFFVLQNWLIIKCS